MNIFFKTATASLIAFSLMAIPSSAHSSNSGRNILIGVMDFDGREFSRPTLETVRELLTTGLINLKKFKIIERSQMNMILKEKGFSMTGCTERSCSVDAGKILKANKMVYGTVWKERESIYELICIKVSYVDVKNGIEEYTQTEKCNSIDTIDAAVFRLVDKISAKIEGPRKSVEEIESPLQSACVSVLPFWSGSLNYGFNPYGFLFLMGKISFIIFSTGSACFLIAVVPITIGDIIYTYNYISGYNKIHFPEAEDTAGGVSLSPRYRRIEKPPAEFAVRPDGINIMYSLKF